MADKSGSKGSDTAARKREDRLGAALKSNLARRKAQTRARTQAEELKTGKSVSAGSEKDA